MYGINRTTLAECKIEGVSCQNVIKGDDLPQEQIHNRYITGRRYFASPSFNIPSTYADCHVTIVPHN